MPAQGSLVAFLLLLLCAGAARGYDPHDIQPYHADPIPSPAVMQAMKAQAARAAAAAPTLPDYTTCTLSWNLTALNVYDLSGPATQAQLQAMTPTAVVPLTPPITPTWVCPPEPRTHYVYSALVDGSGKLQTAGLPDIFTVKGGSPPLVFAVGAKVQVTATLLNVRDAAGGKILGVQPKGATAVIVGGRLLIGTDVWWQVQYATLTGWCMESFLAVVP